MHALKIAVRTLCMIAFATGAVDSVNGVGLLTLGGARLGGAANDPMLNSQIGFWGAIWFGFGIILWRASSHLRSEVELFRMLCGTVALSGLARLYAAFVHGLPGPVLTAAMMVELLAGTGFILWHASALRQLDQSTTAKSPSS